jgi:putative exosortase-associated protein (TIGR04073 family)
MRKTLSLLGTAVALAVLGIGCAGPEQKFGRGISNTAEITRGSEFERSMEQGGMFGGTDNGFGTGLVQGFNKTVARTGIGIYEVVTAPIPPYGPVCTNYLSPKPGHPDSYTTRKWAEPWNDSDHYFGFSGGDVAPWFFGSHFTIFDN